MVWSSLLQAVCGNRKNVAMKNCSIRFKRTSVRANNEEVGHGAGLLKNWMIGSSASGCVSVHVPIKMQPER